MRHSGRRSRSLLLAAASLSVICAVARLSAQTAAIPADLDTNLSEAAADGDVDAQVTRAELILGGTISGDVNAARATLDAAAHAGHVRAAFALGAMAYDGSGLPRDHAAAMRWWRQAAAGGNADAEFNLGLLLARTGGNETAAQDFLRAAAERRHVLACFALGTQLALVADPAAESWLQCAAIQGYAPAQFNLATVYAHAADDPARAALARTWFAASASSFAPAAAALAALPPAPAITSDAAPTVAAGHPQIGRAHV